MRCCKNCSWFRRTPDAGMAAGVCHEGVRDGLPPSKTNERSVCKAFRSLPTHWRTRVAQKVLVQK